MDVAAVGTASARARMVKPKKREETDAHVQPLSSSLKASCRCSSSSRRPADDPRPRAPRLPLALLALLLLEQCICCARCCARGGDRVGGLGVALSDRGLEVGDVRGLEGDGGGRAAERHGRGAVLGGCAGARGGRGGRAGARGAARRESDEDSDGDDQATGTRKALCALPWPRSFSSACYLGLSQAVETGRQPQRHGISTGSLQRENEGGR